MKLIVVWPTLFGQKNRKKKLGLIKIPKIQEKQNNSKKRTSVRAFAAPAKPKHAKKKNI